tara:strand:- start:43 stop:672 length:630 start_codon:yes stop_codon:yes gene_type:complete
MDNFDIKKYLTENQLTPNSVMMYRENPIIIHEGILQDLGAKVKPALDKIFSVGKSKSKQAYDIIKKEVTDPDKAKKALEIVNKSYQGIKAVADSATGNPDKLKSIQKFMPSLKNLGIVTGIGTIYQLASGFDIVSTGWFSSPDIVWGDPTIALMIGGFLVTLKLVIYALQAIAGIRKGVDTVKGMFTEDMDDVDFSDIESIFENAAIPR